MSEPISSTSRLSAAPGEATRCVTHMLVKRLTGAWSGPHGRVQHTLLAVCPNSEVVACAALQAAKEARAPLLYAATLNQVDRDGGYTGWTPASFANFVEAEVDRLGVDVPVALCLDHGGPWKKDDHVQQDLSYEASRSAVLKSIRACIDAGYDLLHLDPTVDLRLSPGQPVLIPDIVERTVGLLREAETYRQSVGRGPLAYEVGTEESGGGLRTENRFCSFLQQLAKAVDESGLPRPSFVVGDVGDAARHLACQHGAYRATHNRGSAAHRRAPQGPLHRFREAPRRVPDQRRGRRECGSGACRRRSTTRCWIWSRWRTAWMWPSGLPDALRSAVVDSGRWRKWLRPEEHGLDFGALPRERRDWLVHTGSRYVWTHPDVQDARERLYANVRSYRDPEAFVHWRVREEILQYMHAFNLVGLADRISGGRGAGIEG